MIIMLITSCYQLPYNGMYIEEDNFDYKNSVITYDTILNPDGTKTYVTIYTDTTGIYLTQ